MAAHFVFDMKLCLFLVFFVIDGAGRRFQGFVSRSPSSRGIAPWYVSDHYPTLASHRRGQALRNLQMQFLGQTADDWYAEAGEASRGFPWEAFGKPKEEDTKRAMVGQPEWWNAIYARAGLDDSPRSSSRLKHKRKTVAKRIAKRKQKEPRKSQSLQSQAATDQDNPWLPIFGSEKKKDDQSKKIELGSIPGSLIGGLVSFFNPKNDSRPPEAPEAQRISSVEIMARDELMSWKKVAESRSGNGGSKDIVKSLEAVNDQLDSCEVFGLIYQQSLDKDDKETAPVLSLMTVSFEEVPIDSEGILRDVAQRTFGKTSDASVKVAVIKGLVGWPGSTMSSSVERNLVLLQKVIRMAYSRKRLVLLDPTNIWPIPAQQLLQFQWPGSKQSEQVASAEAINYFRSLGFQELDLNSPYPLVYSREVPGKSASRVVVMVKLKTRSFRKALLDLLGGSPA